MLTLYDTWTNIKTLVDNYNVALQYIENTDIYKIYAIYGQNMYVTELWINTNKVEGINVNQNNIDKEDFENNYKSQSEGIYNEMGVDKIGAQNVESVSLSKKNYKCEPLEVSFDEQEYDLGSVYTEFNIMVTGNADVIIKLNENTNDEIPLKGGEGIRDIIGSDTFEIRKIYYKTTGSGINSEILLWATKR